VCLNFLLFLGDPFSRVNLLGTYDIGYSFRGPANRSALGLPLFWIYTIFIDIYKDRPFRVSACTGQYKPGTETQYYACLT